MKDALDESLSFEVHEYKDGMMRPATVHVASEIPLTITANAIELGTLLCSPGNLKELTAGFLFASGFIHSRADLKSCSIDTVRWHAVCELSRTPDPEIVNKRLYTAGCGKGVLYASVSELSDRRPIESNLAVKAKQLVELSHWLHHASEVYRQSGGIHTAALSLEGSTPPVVMDDIGRHNAVDKVIGSGIINGVDFSRTLLIGSGRASTEVIHKARRAGIPFVISRSAPTHQSVMRARDQNITLIGYARGKSFIVYSCPERIIE